MAGLDPASSDRVGGGVLIELSSDGSRYNHQTITGGMYTTARHLVCNY